MLEFGAFFGVKYSPMEQVKFDPNKFAVLYYFGDLSYWQLPAISADALVQAEGSDALPRNGNVQFETNLPSRANFRFARHSFLSQMRTLKTTLAA